MVEYDIFMPKELIFLRSRSDLRVLFVMRKKWAKKKGTNRVFSSVFIVFFAGFDFQTNILNA